MVGQLADLQQQHKRWVDHNFPSQPGWQPLLGLVEEVGELAHVHLKHAQNIRGLEDYGVAHGLKIDAVGDIFIYLMSYCNAENIDLEQAILHTWHGVVQKRDWRQDARQGA